jgi:hypothetical protein
LQALEVDNHIANTKYCLTQLLSNHGKNPLYQKVAQSKSYKDICAALEIEYTEKLSDIPSRGEKSAVAKAAEGSKPVKCILIEGNTSHKQVKAHHALRGITEKDHVSAQIETTGGIEQKQSALTV